MILVYGDMDSEANDPWVVRVLAPSELAAGAADGEGLLHTSAHQLLTLNSTLRARLLRDANGRSCAPESDLIESDLPSAASSPYFLRKAAEPKSTKPKERPPTPPPPPPPFFVGDYALQNLHLLARLHEIAETRPGSLVRVLFLPSSAVEAALRGMAGEASEEMQTDDTQRASELQLLCFSSSPSPNRSRVEYQYCRSWPAAVAAASAAALLPLRIVYIQTLMWFRRWATEAQRQRGIDALLRAVPSRPLLHPFVGVNAATDQKDHTAAIFGAHMLPQLWVPVQQQQQQQFDAAAMCAPLLEFARRHGVARRYVIKGSFSTCGYSYRSVEVDAAGQCPELRAVVHQLVEQQHQHCIGIQPFSASLRHREYRFWLVAHARPVHQQQPPTAAYRVATAVETHPTAGSSTMDVSTFDGSTDGGLACSELVDTLLRSQDPLIVRFWQTLLQLRIPALRVDCFYDGEESYLNELAPAPDAVVFTHTHETQVVRVIGRAMADQWADLALAAAGGGGAVAGTDIAEAHTILPLAVTQH